MTKRLRVKVEPGLFPSERTVSFEAGGRQYSLVVDQRDVQDDTLPVYVVAEHEDEALIDLPRETFTSGSRVRIPRAALLEPNGSNDPL
jgi:hypothetical protein